MLGQFQGGRNSEIPLNWTPPPPTCASSHTYLACVSGPCQTAAREQPLCSDKFTLG